MCVCVNVSALKIHMSETARDALVAFPEFITERRGDISVKVSAVVTIILIRMTLARLIVLLHLC